jgi:hypothetical protein
MVYTRTVELSQLGAAWLGATVNNSTYAYHDVLALVTNTTDPFNVPAVPVDYGRYEKHSVCFVEPMVRLTPQTTSPVAVEPTASPSNPFAQLGCYSVHEPRQRPSRDSTARFPFLHLEPS